MLLVRQLASNRRIGIVLILLLLALLPVLPAPNPVALREPGLTALPRLIVHGLILGRQHIQGETLRSSWRFQGRHGSAGSQRQRQR